MRIIAKILMILTMCEIKKVLRQVPKKGLSPRIMPSFGQVFLCLIF